MTFEAYLMRMSNVLWPVLAILLLEHVLLKYLYKKTTSLERLLKRRTASGKTDIFMSVFYYSLFLIPKTFVRIVTVPGIAFLGMIWVIKKYHWHGVLGLDLGGHPLLQALLWFVALDIAHYCAHYSMHKFTWLWRFHKLHHAATEFNILTGNRVAIGEKILNQMFVLTSIGVLLGLPRPDVIFTVMLVRRIIDLLQHSDLPWDYGVFGYIFASPRFHRMHHSSVPIDYNSNYGNIFSLWDYALRTVSARYRKNVRIADEVPLGLDTEHETVLYNRWKWALINETFFEYLIKIGIKVSRKKTVK